MRGYITGPSDDGARKQASGDAAQAVLDLQRRWVRALIDADTAALDMILVDTYVDTDEGGTRTDEAGILAALKLAVSSWRR